jgi:hypothetical protein
MTVLASPKRMHSPRLHRRVERPVPAAPRKVEAGRRRELGPQADQALYTCGCGFVFHAVVSTSVGCPHCGDTQAW